METMKHQVCSVNIYDINYPCYVSPIPKGERIVHVPGQYEFKYLDNIYSFVVEAYKTDEKLLLFDAVPLYLWQKKICQLRYEKRLKYVRELVYGQVANVEKVMDLESVLIDNPVELTDYCDNLLTQGYAKARIMDVNGHYVFGQAQNGEYLELEL